MLILDRYLIKNFLLVLIFSIVALCSIFIIVDVLEKLDDFLDRSATTFVIITYYMYRMPEIIELLTPVAILISILFSVGRLSNSNEITAMKGGSMSLYRIILPFAILCIILSFWQLYFNGWVVPLSNEKKAVIEQKYLHQTKSGVPLNNLYLRDSPTRIIIIQFYDSNKKTGNNVAVEDYSGSQEPRLLKRFEAKQMVWDSLKSVWKLISCIERDFSNNSAKQDYHDTTEITLNITHNQIIKLQKLPEEMNFSEMKDYINILQMGGKDVQKLLIDYYGNYAFPFANFIVILFAVPFSSVRRKSGLAFQIAAAMSVSFFYLVFTKISQTLGYSAGLSPLLTAWSANLIFLVLGIIILFKTKT